MLTPKQKAAFLEIAKLAMQIPTSNFSFNKAAKCIYVYEFLDENTTEYKYCFECYVLDDSTEKLDELIESLTSYIKENGITA